MPLQIVFSEKFFGTNLALELQFFVNITLEMFREIRLARKLFIAYVTLFHYFRNVILMLLNK